MHPPEDLSCSAALSKSQEFNAGCRHNTLTGNLDVRQLQIITHIHGTLMSCGYHIIVVVCNRLVVVLQSQPLWLCAMRNGKETRVWSGKTPAPKARPLTQPTGLSQCIVAPVVAGEKNCKCQLSRRESGGLLSCYARIDQ